MSIVPETRRKPVPSRSSNDAPQLAEGHADSKEGRNYETFEAGAFNRILTLRDDSSSLRSEPTVTSSQSAAGPPAYETIQSVQTISGIESAAKEWRTTTAETAAIASTETQQTAAAAPNLLENTAQNSKLSTNEEALAERKPSQNLQTFELDLLVAQKEEAKTHIAKRDYLAAEKSINDILENHTLSTVEAPYWAFRRVHALQMMGRWQDSLLLIKQLESSIWRDPTNDKTYGHMKQYEAEALLQTGDYPAARTACIEALRILEKGKDNAVGDLSKGGNSVGGLGDSMVYDLGDPAIAFNTCMELMVRTAQALEKPLEVQFYKSRVVDGYVSETAMAQENREGFVAERVQILKRYHLRYEHNFDNYQSPVRIYGEEGRDYGKDFMNAFEDSLMRQDDSLIEILLQEDNIFSLNGRHLQIPQASLGASETCPGTAFYYAIKHGSEKCVLHLIRNGADLNSPILDTREKRRPLSDDYPYEALSIACRFGQMRIAGIFLENGAHINGNEIGISRWRFAQARDLANRLTTPLHQALRYGTPEIAKMLIQLGCDHDIYDCKMMTALHVAAWKGYDEVVEMLLARGADIQKRGGTDVQKHAWATNKSNSPLHFAAQAGRVSTARLLLSKGASPYEKNIYGDNPSRLVKLISDKTTKAEMKAILKQAQQQGSGSWMQRKFG